MTAEEMVATPAGKIAAKTIVPSILPADDEPALRRWIFAAAVVVLVHAAIVFWILYVRESEMAGAPPAVIMIELPPMDVAPPQNTPLDVPEGPEMTEATPEVVEEQQVIPVPELPSAAKPNVVLLAPRKPKPKPKKIVKEVPEKVVKHDLLNPRTTAPKHSEARQGPKAASRQGTSGAGASISNWQSQVIAQLLRHKPSGGADTGTARVSFTLTRSGHLIGSSLAGSSGSSVLDQKALAMVRASNPFPAAPPNYTGGFSFTVPVNFHH